MFSFPAPIPYTALYHCGELTFNRPLIMGIANITPDSFYDGGRYNEPMAAAAHIMALCEAGADIIDIGAASSRPGYTPISITEELRRLLPVLELIAPEIPLPISVDTDKMEVAQAALQAGAAIINDIAGLKKDMACLAAACKAPLVLMHQGGGGLKIVETVISFFREKMADGQAEGMRQEQFILDPGFGFGKDTKEDILLLRHLADLHILSRPLLIGLSNKRFIGALTKTKLHERYTANIVASAWAMIQGAAIIRTHDPKALREAAMMITELLNYSAE
ncbi:MAG: dihydropteroate synthase [Clostridiales bacterium]|nr:dihydropteroate synthase [Clostridiales bacterium]